MAEAAAACGLVGAAPAAPRRQPVAARRQPVARRVAGLRCRAAAGDGVPTPTPMDVLRNDVCFLEDLHGELVEAHRSAHDEVRRMFKLLAFASERRQQHTQAVPCVVVALGAAFMCCTAFMLYQLLPCSRARIHASVPAL